MTALRDISHSIDIEAPRSTVWEVLTARESMPRWFGCMGYEGRVGTTFHMQPDAARRAAHDVTGATCCDIEELRGHERMRFTWYMAGAPKTTVTIALDDLGGDITRAVLSHTGWSQFSGDEIRTVHGALDTAWRNYALPALKKAAEDFRRAMS